MPLCGSHRGAEPDAARSHQVFEVRPNSRKQFMLVAEAQGPVGRGHAMDVVVTYGGNGARHLDGELRLVAASAEVAAHQRLDGGEPESRDRWCRAVFTPQRNGSFTELGSMLGVDGRGD